MPEGTRKNRSRYHLVQSGDGCWAIGQMYGITFAQLQSWNAAIDNDCTNLWLGYSYCVAL